jgi:hypothetical protein
MQVLLAVVIATIIVLSVYHPNKPKNILPAISVMTLIVPADTLPVNVSTYIKQAPERVDHEPGLWYLKQPCK